MHVVVYTHVEADGIGEVARSVYMMGLNSP